MQRLCDLKWPSGSLLSSKEDKAQEGEIVGEQNDDLNEVACRAVSGDAHEQ